MLWSRLFIPTLRTNRGRAALPAVAAAGGLLARRGSMAAGRAPIAIAGSSASCAKRWMPRAGRRCCFPMARRSKRWRAKCAVTSNCRSSGIVFGARDGGAVVFARAYAVLDALCRRVLDRCGVPYAVTERSLVVYAEEGADSVAACAGCGYAAPMELAEAAASQDGDRRSCGRSGSRTVSHAGPQDDRAGGRIHGPAGKLADEEPGAGGEWRAGSGDAARRPPVERSEIRRAPQAMRTFARRDPTSSSNGSARERVRSGRWA